MKRLAWSEDEGRKEVRVVLVACPPKGEKDGRSRAQKSTDDEAILEGEVPKGKFSDEKGGETADDTEREAVKRMQAKDC